MPFTVAQTVGVAQQLDTSNQPQMIEQLKKNLCNNNRLTIFRNTPNYHD